jgi:hypothetical protein
LGKEGKQQRVGERKASERGRGATAALEIGREGIGDFIYRFTPGGEGHMGWSSPLFTPPYFFPYFPFSPSSEALPCYFAFSFEW